VPASIGKARSLLRIEHSVGEGYAVATSEELSFLAEVARSTGVSTGEKSSFSTLSLLNVLLSKSAPYKEDPLF